MALDFPNNPPPQPGTVFTGTNNVTYVYDGTKWIGQTSATGSGAGVPVWQLTSSTAVVSLDSDGKLTLSQGGAFTSPNYGFSFNKNSGKTGAPELGTDVTFATENLSSDILDGEVYMGSGYGEFRSIYNKVDSTESGLVYAGVEGFNYAQYGDVNFAGIVSQTPHIDSMYTVGVNTLSQITIGFTQNGQTQESMDWSVAVGSLTTDYTFNGLFADTFKTVISGSQEIKLTTNRGTVLFGNQPECVPTLLRHFHIMKEDPANVDLFLGDDYNYVKLPGNGETAYGVEIGTNGPDGANTWRFGTDGVLILPVSTTGTSVIKSTTSTNITVAGVASTSTSLAWYNIFGELNNSTSTNITIDGSVVYDTEGNLFVLGSTFANGDNFPGANLFLKYSPQGQLLWRKTWTDPVGDACGSYNASMRFLPMSGTATIDTIVWASNGDAWANSDRSGYIGTMDLEGNLVDLQGQARAPLALPDYRITDIVPLFYPGFNGAYVSGSWYDRADTGWNFPAIAGVDFNDVNDNVNWIFIPTDLAGDQHGGGHFKSINAVFGALWATGSYNSSANGYYINRTILGLLDIIGGDPGSPTPYLYTIGNNYPGYSMWIEDSGSDADSNIYGLINVWGYNNDTSIQYNNHTVLASATLNSTFTIDRWQKKIRRAGADDGGSTVHGLGLANHEGYVYVSVLLSDNGGDNDFGLLKLDSTTGAIVWARTIGSPFSEGVWNDWEGGYGSSSDITVDPTGNYISFTAITQDQSTGTQFSNNFTIQYPLDGSLLGTFNDFEITDSIAEFVVTDHDFDVVDITSTANITTATFTVTTATLTASATTVGTGWTNFRWPLEAEVTGTADQTWTFGADGSLAFPTAGAEWPVTEYYVPTLIGKDQIYLSTYNAENTSTSYAVLAQDNKSWEVFAEDDSTRYSGWASLKVELPTIDTPQVNIETRKGIDGVNYTWTFDANGILTIPDTGDILRDGISAFATRWDATPTIPGNNCPIFAELTPDHFYAYTQRSHIELDNDGHWYIGSNADATGLYGLGNTATLYSNFGDVVIRTGENDLKYFTFDSNGSLTFPDATLQTTAWQGAAIVSDTAPTDPKGRLWFNTSDGRTYIQYADQWVETNPTTIPVPSTYLGEITVDGSVININDSTLTINTSGTLLVNGESIISSSYQLTSGTAVVSLNANGAVSFPRGSFGPDEDTGAYLVGNNHLGIISNGITLIAGSGYNQISLDHNNSTRSSSVTIDFQQEYGGPASAQWVFDQTDSKLTFPDNTHQYTAWTGTVAYSNVTGTPSMPNFGNFAFSGNTLSNTLSDASTLQVGGNSWIFGSSGQLTFPNSTVQTTAWTGTVAYSNITGVPSLTTSTLVNSGYTASLGSNGNLTLPGSIVFPDISGPTLQLVQNTNLLIRTNATSTSTNPTIRLANYVQGLSNYGSDIKLLHDRLTIGTREINTWTFGTDGTLTLPTTGVITTVPGYVGSAVGITSITTGTTTTVVAPGHGLSEGDKITITGIDGASTLQLNNGLYYAHVSNTSTVTLFTDPNLTASLNSTGYSPYTYYSPRSTYNKGTTYNSATPLYTSSTHYSYSGGVYAYGSGFIDIVYFVGVENIQPGWAISLSSGFTGTVSNSPAPYDLGIGRWRITFSGSGSVGGGSYTITGDIAGSPIGGSISFTGTNVVQVKNSADFYPSGDWTVEMFFNTQGNGQYQQADNATLFSLGSADNASIALRSAGGFLQIGTTGTFYSAGFLWPSDSNWHHVAVTSQSGTIHGYLDGYLVANEPGLITPTYNANDTFSIGASSPDNNYGVGTVNTSTGFTGLITNFRFVNGTAKYTGTYTVPSTQLTTTATTTELLLLADIPGSYLADSTNTQANLGGGNLLKEFRSGNLTLTPGTVTTEDPGNVVVELGTSTWTFNGETRAIDFPDGTHQTTAYPLSVTNFVGSSGNSGVYNVSTVTDNVILVSTATGYASYVQILLPTNNVSIGKKFTIKKTIGNNVLVFVQSASGGNIDGNNAGVSITNHYGYVTVVWDGTQYWILDQLLT